MINTKPFKFQEEAADFIESTGGKAILAMDMGTGKSLSALLYAYRHPELRPIVIVCPATVRHVWERECSVHFGWRAEIVETTRPKEAPLPSKPKIIICNYDILAKRRGDGCGPGWLNTLKRLKPKLIIVDESHYCVSLQAARTKAITALCEIAPSAVLLSGTPLVNRPVELWPALSIVAPKLFPSRYAFCHAYCGAKRTIWGWKFDGATKLDELNRKLQPIMFRRRKADVLKDLPAKRRSVVPLDIENRKEYEQARDDFSGWLSDQSPEKLATARKAEAVVKIGHLKRLAAQLKLKSAIEWIATFLRDTDEKLLVFGIHRETIVEKIYEKFPGSSLITGNVTGKNRQLAIDKFIKSKDCRMLVGNIDAAGVGWSAKGVSNVAFVELPWSCGKVTQAEDRCHGLGRGQEGIRTVSHFLVGHGTIEEKLCDILQRKQKTLNAVLDGGKSKGDNLDLFDQLTKEIRKETNKG